MGTGAAVSFVMITGLQQLAIASAQVTAWIAVIAAVLAVLMIALRWYLGRRTRRMPFPKERVHEDTQPSEVIDDALPTFFERGPALADDVTEAIKRMEREWHAKQRDGRRD